MNIENDQLFTEFCEDRQLKPGTIRNYRYHLEKYSKITGKRLQQLIDEAEDEEDREVKKRQRKIKKYMAEYQKTLIEDKCTPSGIKIAISIVRSFYSHYDIDPLKRLTYRPEEKETTLNDSTRIPDLADIKHALKFVKNVKHEAIIKLMMSSGMGQAEIVSLTVEHFLNGVKEYYDVERVKTPADMQGMCQYLVKKSYIVPEWQIKRIKINHPYFTFCTPEAAHAICIYLLSHPPKTREDYLFRNQHGKKLHRNGISAFFLRIDRKAKFKIQNTQRKTKQHFFKSHNLRRFFASTLIAAHMSKYDIDALLGHKQKSQDGSYFKPNIQTIKDIYTKYMHHLTIENVRYRTVTTNEIKEIVNELTGKVKELEMYKYYHKNKDNPEFQKIKGEI